MAVNNERLVSALHMSLVGAVSRVILECVGGVVIANERIVDGNHLHSTKAASTDALHQV